MIIATYYHCAMSKSYPIKFYAPNGDERDYVEPDCLMSKEECELFIKHSDEPDNLTTIMVRLSYEI